MSHFCWVFLQLDHVPDPLSDSAPTSLHLKLVSMKLVQENFLRWLVAHVDGLGLFAPPPIQQLLRVLHLMASPVLNSVASSSLGTCPPPPLLQGPPACLPHPSQK